jgi:formiminotetrahydrofolate cyclodeaminase
MFFLIYRREEAIEIGIKNAIKVPLSLAQIISKLWSNIKELAHVIHYPTKSDLQVFIFRVNAISYSLNYILIVYLLIRLESIVLRSEF